jgi:hypothetical protein
MPREYPEPSLFGVLPAYGIYVRHARGLTVENVSVTTKVADQRPAVVLDDVADAAFPGFSADIPAGVPAFVEVQNTRKRLPVREYVKDEPYVTTSVSNVAIPPGFARQDVLVTRPAPGTPPDSLYAFPTAPSAAAPFAYAVANAAYPKPLTVHRPAFDAIADPRIAENQSVMFTVNARTPATGVTLAYSAQGLPRGATFDAATHTFAWTPDYRQAGRYSVRFVVDDGVIPETKDVAIDVADVPASVLVQDLTDFVATLGLPGDIAQSLEDKLAAASSSLAGGNTKAATNQLRAFVNAVNAQAGKKIPRSAADDLIARAQAIVYSLG